MREEQTHAILTTKFCHTVVMYHESCKEMGYEPLSNSSLIRVVHAIKPYQRKCLAGLDDVTAAGMHAFAELQKVANKFNSKSCFNSLEKNKRYLKTRYLYIVAVPIQILHLILQNFLCLIRRTNSYNLTSLSNNTCTECFELCTALQNIQDFLKHLMCNAQQKS